MCVLDFPQQDLMNIKNRQIWRIGPLNRAFKHEQPQLVVLVLVFCFTPSAHVVFALKAPKNRRAN